MCPFFQGSVATRAELGGGDEESESAVPVVSAPDGGTGTGGGDSGGGGGSNGGGRETASPSLPASNLVYKAKDYWDSRFAEEESYDVSEKRTETTPRMPLAFLRPNNFVHDESIVFVFFFEAALTPCEVNRAEIFLFFMGGAVCWSGLWFCLPP